MCACVCVCVLFFPLCKRGCSVGSLPKGLGALVRGAGMYGADISRSFLEDERKVGFVYRENPCGFEDMRSKTLSLC